MKDPYNRHPAADFLFYALAVFFTAEFRHPVFLAINFISPLIYAITLGGKKTVKLFAWVCVPVFALITASNTAFSHYGITTLAVLESGNRITLEAIASGIVTGVQAVSLILWFFCFSAVVTQEKYLHVFGRISPRLALLAMLLLRFIPLYSKQFRAAYEVHKGAKHKLTAFFSAIGTVFKLAVEKSFDTSDSMRARGYGLKGRTSYSRFYFAKSDIAAVMMASVFAAATVLLHRSEPAEVLYNPIIIIGKLSSAETAAAFFYALFCITPALLYFAFLIKTEVKPMKKFSTLLLCALMFLCASCNSGSQNLMQTSAEVTTAPFVAESLTEHSESVSVSKTQTVHEPESSVQISSEASQAASAPATTASKPADAPKNTCTVSINCVQITKNKSNLKAGKEYFLPASGYILKETQVEFKEGETVFDVFKRACQTSACTDNCAFCKQSGIQYEASYNPGFENYYIEGIHQIYEKDCGPLSGWMYKVNGVFPNYGCSSYKLKSGDKIEFIYTCDLGADIGASFD